MSEHRPDTRDLINRTTSATPLTVGEVARLLHMNPKTVKRKAAAHAFGPFEQVVSHSQGGHWRFNPHAIARYQRAQRQQPHLF